MKHLAKALLNAAAFLELSPEGVVDLDASVGALEQIASDLQGLSAHELEALKVAAAELAAEASGADRLSFFESFFESFGLTSEG